VLTQGVPWGNTAVEARRSHRTRRQAVAPPEPQATEVITEIDGLDIHFIHARSKHDDAVPLIVNHGWPGSIIEQLKIIDRLTDPTAYGASAADAFDVVVPSMPGYGFSGKPTSPAGAPSAWAAPGTYW
jgi:pimeloyl-ACP methyl ester carboxylesterase